MRFSWKWNHVGLLGLLLALNACDGNDAEPPASDGQVEPLKLKDNAETADTQTPSAPQSIPDADYTVLEGGLKSYDIKEGTGDTPQRGSKVTVHYTGWLLDGTQFDSSKGRARPFSFRLETGSVIKGWHLGVAGMKVGGTRQLVIPSELAYGKSKKGKIPADSTLVFEIELLEVGDIRVPPDAMPTPTNWVKGEKGLQYHELKEGSGETVKESSGVTAEITMWLESGEFIMSTFQSEKPMTFVQGGGRVVPGWDIGSLGMKAGGSRLVKMPPELGFGERGRGKIGPNATVFTQIDLLEVGAPRVAPDNVPKYDAGKLTTTDSGLQYTDLVEGSGASPSTGQTVIVEYTGWLMDGTRFDSSLLKPDSFKFPLGMRKVIKGWDEGVASMKVGGTRILRIPPDLAYGKNGSPPVIPPESTLIFQVELKGIQ